MLESKDDSMVLSNEDLKELKVVFRNKSLQKWTASLEEIAAKHNILLGCDLSSEQGRIAALKKQGHVEGLLFVLGQIQTFLE